MLYAGLQYVSKGSGWPPVDHGSDLGQHLTLVAVGLHLRDIHRVPQNPGSMNPNQFNNIRILTDSSIKLTMHSTP